MAKIMVSERVSKKTIRLAIAFTHVGRRHPPLLHRRKQAYHFSSVLLHCGRVEGAYIIICLEQSKTRRSLLLVTGRFKFYEQHFVVHFLRSFFASTRTILPPSGKQRKLKFYIVSLFDKFVDANLLQCWFSEPSAFLLLPAYVLVRRVSTEDTFQERGGQH